MEDRASIVSYIREAGSLDDRKNIKQEFMKADLKAIKEMEAKCFEHAKIVADMKDLGLSYQWHENKANDFKTEMDKLTTNFLFKYK